MAFNALENNKQLSSLDRGLLDGRLAEKAAGGRGRAARARRTAAASRVLALHMPAWSGAKPHQPPHTTEENRAGDRFRTLSAVHDLNNQLMVIKGSADLIAAHKSADEEAIRAILKAISQCKKLTYRLLGSENEGDTVVDLPDLISDLIARLRPAMPKTIRVRSRAEAGSWRAEVNRGKLVDALMNLVVNARDAMPSGGQVSISTGNETLTRGSAVLPSQVKPGGFVRIEVSDTGTGIASADLERVFDPFFSTKAHGEVRGIGLASVLRFAKSSGGFVRATSEMGIGTAVTLYLPRTKAKCTRHSTKRVQQNRRNMPNA